MSKAVYCFWGSVACASTATGIVHSNDASMEIVFLTIQNTFLFYKIHPDFKEANPNAQQGPADDGGVKYYPQPPVEVIKIQCGVTFFAGMQAFQQAGQYPDTREEHG